MEYPFEISKVPENDRVSREQVSDVVEKCTTELFPHIISNEYAFVAGCPKDEWDDLYECMLIYCHEHRIPKMVFVWDDEMFVSETHDWKTLFSEIRPDFREHLTETYKIGSCLPLLDTPHNSLESFCVINTTIQMYLSPSTENKSSSVNTTIPKLTQANPSCLAIIRRKQLKCYCHSSLAMNLANPGWHTYVGDLISYATAHSFNGVVFHCGKTTKHSKEESLENMATNIIEGLRSKKMLESKFLLETPANQKNDLLADIIEFMDFVSTLQQNEDVGHLISVCVDTCHVFAAGYDPYTYLKEFHSRIPVSLVHFNDSMGGWNCHVDRHAEPGKGKIPYPLLEKVASFCVMNNIDMVYEC